jgi:hypothetical protein
MMPLADPIALAHALAHDDGPDLPPGALAWLRAGMRRFLRGDASLDVALQLTGARRVATRNAALLRAATLLAAGTEVSDWNQAAQLAGAIKRFESVILPRWRRDEAMYLCDVDAALLAAHQSGARKLRSPRRLYDLLTIYR